MLVLDSRRFELGVVGTMLESLVTCEAIPMVVVVGGGVDGIMLASLEVRTKLFTVFVVGGVVAGSMPRPLVIASRSPTKPVVDEGVVPLYEGS